MSVILYNENSEQNKLSQKHFKKDYCQLYTSGKIWIDELMKDSLTNLN